MIFISFYTLLLFLENVFKSAIIGNWKSQSKKKGFFDSISIFSVIKKKRKNQFFVPFADAHHKG